MKAKLPACLQTKPTTPAPCESGVHDHVLFRAPRGSLHCQGVPNAQRLEKQARGEETPALVGDLQVALKRPTPSTALVFPCTNSAAKKPSV